MPTLLAEIGQILLMIFLSEISLLQTAQTGLIAFETGRSAYDAGNYRPVKSQLQRSLDAFGELPASACQTYVDRAEKGLEILARIEIQQARVARAIAACDSAEMRKILGAYSKRKHRFYVGAIARINAALPNCRKDDQVIAAGRFCEAARGALNTARAGFNVNRLVQAECELNTLNARLAPEKTKI